MLHDVEPRAVAHRRGMQNGIALRNRIDLGAIGSAGDSNITMSQHRAFRLAGRSRCVEQPGEIVARARHDVDGVGGEQQFVVGAADRDHPLQRFWRMRRDLAIDALRGKADARAGVFEDVAQLGTVQLGIGRHGDAACVPDAIEQRQIVRRIFRDDGDAVAGLEFELVTQRAGDAGSPSGQFAVAHHHALARSGGGQCGMR